MRGAPPAARHATSSPSLDIYVVTLLLTNMNTSVIMAQVSSGLTIWFILFPFLFEFFDENIPIRALSRSDDPVLQMYIVCISFVAPGPKERITGTGL